MNQRILDFFKTVPPLYEKSSKAFWDDEHISKSMLAAHFDREHDGASRKMSTVQTSAEWICQCCPDAKGRQLLDLGCGPGIYSELLYDKGFSVTGLDFSKRSIAYAQDHAKKTGRNIAYHYQNYLEMNYENLFDIAILIYCDFGVLSPKDRGILLSKIHRALKKDGLLVLDVLHQPYRNTFQGTQSVQYEAGGFWSPEPYVVIQRNQYYGETDNTLEQYLVITEKNWEHFNIWNQVYTRESFVGEVERRHFVLKDIFADVCGRAFTEQGENMCGVFVKGR